MKDVEAINEVCEELTAATSRYGSFRDMHEGWGKIYEEVDELWDEVKAWKSAMPEGPYKVAAREKLRAEAKQVAAMAIRFMMDLT